MVALNTADLSTHLSMVKVVNFTVRVFHYWNDEYLLKNNSPSSSCQISQLLLTAKTLRKCGPFIFTVPSSSSLVFSWAHPSKAMSNAMPQGLLSRSLLAVTLLCSIVGLGPPLASSLGSTGPSDQAPHLAHGAHTPLTLLPSWAPASFAGSSSLQ